MSTQLASTPTILSPVAAITYLSLWTQYEAYLKKNKKTGAANIKTALNAFKEVHNLTDDSIPGKELDDDEEFERRLEEYLDQQAREGIRRSTRHTRSSYLRKFREFYKSIVKVEPLPIPTDFAGRLKRRIEDLNLTPWQFRKRFAKNVVDFRTLNRWTLGQTVPSRKRILTVRKLEKFLGVETGDLTDCLPMYLLHKGNRKAGQTDFGKKIQKAMKAPYKVWTKAIEEEWKELVVFKSATSVKKGERRGKNAVWTSTVGADLPSASILKKTLRYLFGYCCLPIEHADPFLRGLGMRCEEMSLSLLADLTVIEGYLKFIMLRAGGKHHGGSLTYLASMSSLLHPEYGYLTQHPEIARKFDNKLTDEAWREKCRDTRDRIAVLKSDVLYHRETESNLYGKGRDPMEPIAEILALDRPLIPILEAVKTMLRLLPPGTSSNTSHVIRFRDMLLVALMAANPLRARQFSIMEFGKHLVKEKNGSWWLKFKKGEFKNRRSIKGDYSVRVAPAVWPMIERYQKEFRPLLAGAETTNYVFRPKSGNSNSKDVKKIGKYNSKAMSAASIRVAIVKATYKFIPSSNGFSPHGFRHIVATDIIKENPKLGFFLAAKALHDKLETVEEEYAHLMTHEFFEPYNDHFAERWHEAMSDDEAGDFES
jgi:integrase